MQARNVETVIVGSGAAGLNASDLLWKKGVRDVVLVTEGIKAGTSRNTGSDKQTYYKLSLSGCDSDSIMEMAQDLYKGKCVDGDVALCEAALSVPSFTRLASLGVPFPHDRYGQYIGYRTDHDPKRRATSAGPYTSRYMTEALEKAVLDDGLEIIDGYQLIKIIASDNEVRGVLFISRRTNELLLIRCRSLILATGGPAGIYSMSVYPESQFGATGLAFEAGVMGKNLTEWQYGLASCHPRWNVSGSYMQVIPRFVSVDRDGTEYDFLSSYPLPREEMLSRVFLKGYQWPFDARKINGGSSLIDVLCYLELEKGRRVYLDFMHNPDNTEIPFAALQKEAREYLEAAGALGRTPIERLHQLNEPAYQFYLDKKVDLEHERLEISLSAQHNNGGLAIDLWWQSNVSGIFPVGECAASHGVYRPGGSALNAGQVGSSRAVEYIAAKRTGGWDSSCSMDEEILWAENIINNSSSGTIDAEDAYSNLRKRMSLYASCIRDISLLKKALAETEKDYEALKDVRVSSPGRIWLLFEYRNALIESRVYLSAMIDYALRKGGSRGSAIYSDEKGSVQPKALDERFRFSLENEDSPDIQEIKLDGNSVSITYRQPRPIPQDDGFFENVWARYRKDGCVY